MLLQYFGIFTLISIFQLFARIFTFIQYPDIFESVFYVNIVFRCIDVCILHININNDIVNILTTIPSKNTITEHREKKLLANAVCIGICNVQPRCVRVYTSISIDTHRPERESSRSIVRKTDFIVRLTNIVLLLALSLQFPPFLFSPFFLFFSSYISPSFRSTPRPFSVFLSFRPFETSPRRWRASLSLRGEKRKPGNRHGDTWNFGAG